MPMGSSNIETHLRHPWIHQNDSGNLWLLIIVSLVTIW